MGGLRFVLTFAVTFASLTLRILANIIVKWALTVAVSRISIALYIRETRKYKGTIDTENHQIGIAS